jgi:hypothetical protein
LDPILYSRISSELDALVARKETFRLCQDLYETECDDSFITETFKTVFGEDAFKGFADNVCRPVVDAASDRTTLKGFNPAKKKAGKVIDELWRVNRLGHVQNLIHVNAYKKGEASLIVWPNTEGGVDIDFNPPEAVRVAYDPAAPLRRKLYAVKRWDDTDGGGNSIVRLNVYFPDRIEKYFSPDQGMTIGGLTTQIVKWDKYQIEGEAWPVPNPWEEVPVFDFPYLSTTSRMKPAIPLQRMINMFWARLAGAADMSVIPQKYILGAEVKIESVSYGPQRVWGFPDKGATAGTFEGADLSQFLDSIRQGVQSVARSTKTPLYMLEGSDTPPAGVALQRLEAPLVADVVSSQETFGNAWEDAMSLACRMAGADPGILEAVWAPPSPPDEWSSGQGAAAVIGAIAMAKDNGYVSEETAREAVAKVLSAAVDLDISAAEEATKIAKEEPGELTGIRQEAGRDSGEGEPPAGFGGQGRAGGSERAPV